MSTMNDELERVLNSSLIGAVGLMWAAALRFNVKRFFN
jgi:hypothetical protein